MLNTWAERLTLSLTAAQSSELPASHTQKCKPFSVYVALE